MVTRICIEFDIPAVMRDGITLSANIFRPDDAGEYPVALCRTPYGKDTSLGPILDVVRLVRGGYIVVIQDVRGRGNSEGEWTAFKHEAQDGYDTVEWAACLPESNGNVGMFGASYVGFTQWVTAVQAPPHLKAIVPAVTWADANDGLFRRGGAFELGLMGYLHLGAFGFETLRRAFRDGSPVEYIQTLHALASEIDALPAQGFASLISHTSMTLKRLGLADEWLAAITNPEAPAYASPFAAPEAYRRVQVPAFNIGGWYDVFAQGTLHNFSAMQTSETAARRSKLLMGPWSHVNFGSLIGEQDFGVGALLGSLDLQTDLTGLTQRWFDYWLKGIQSDIVDEPPVKLFIMGENVWRDEHEWPLKRAKSTAYYLRDGHRLTLDSPGDESPDSYTVDPHDPTPAWGGALQMSSMVAGVKDQRPLETRADLLVYTSEPLLQDTEVTGPIIVWLWAATDSSDFVVRLVDVHPNGFAQNLTDGIIRAEFGDGAADPPYEFKIDLWATANLFKAGHRIRLQIASACFPRWNLHTSSDLRTIFHDASHPSRVMLPIIER